MAESSGEVSLRSSGSILLILSLEIPSSKELLQSPFSKFIDPIFTFFFPEIPLQLLKEI